MKRNMNEEQLRKLSNVDLYDEFVDAQQPDDWDGCFTRSGERYAALTKKVFEERLTKLGFFESLNP